MDVELKDWARLEEEGEERARTGLEFEHLVILREEPGDDEDGGDDARRRVEALVALVLKVLQVHEPASAPAARDEGRTEVDAPGSRR